MNIEVSVLIEETRIKIAELGQLMFDRFLTDTAGGNISARVGDLICITMAGCGIITGWPEGLYTVRETVNGRARSVVRDRLVIDFPTLGEKAGLYGAARLVNVSEAG